MKHRLTFLFILAWVSLLEGQEFLPQTVPVDQPVIVCHLLGRLTNTITKGWPATLLIRFAPGFTPGTQYLLFKDAGGRQAQWPWKTAPEIRMSTGSAAYMTLAPADTAALEPGDYTLSITGRAGNRSVVATYAFLVEPPPGSANESEQATNEANYYRVLQEHDKALVAAEKASRLDPDDLAKLLDFGRCLLDAGKVQEATELAEQQLEKVPPGQSEPPVAFLALLRDARARQSAGK
jgi:hypothetical protein